MLENKPTILYSLEEITIIPEVVTKINSRSQCIPWVPRIDGKKDSEFLPVIAAPMASVVSPENYKTFHDNLISCIIPRNIPLSERLKLCSEVFCAFSMKEIEENFIEQHQQSTGSELYVLIDIANGHMKSQIELGRALKELYGFSIKIMGGNIANPETYKLYDKAGFDYLRVGIGGGAGCITSTQTGIHYPMGSLINDTFQVKRECSGNTKIIADGGISTFSAVIKCLALGADYVMMGSTFGKALEAAGPVLREYYNEYYESLPESVDITRGEKFYREYYGMSTKRAQAEILGKSIETVDREKLKTSEGKSVVLEIEYTLAGWAKNMDSYLRSAMSYTDSYNLEDFKYSRCQVVSEISSVGINKK